MGRFLVRRLAHGIIVIFFLTTVVFVVTRLIGDPVNVMLPLELAGTAGAAQLATSMLERVGLGERLGHYPKYLSGGEQQRVALARAFVMQPKLLLADEPTGNLDADTGAGIIDLMFALNAAAATTLVMVTHDDAIARRCQRQIRLVGGRIFA